MKSETRCSTSDDARQRVHFNSSLHTSVRSSAVRSGGRARAGDVGNVLCVSEEEGYGLAPVLHVVFCFYPSVSPPVHAAGVVSSVAIVVVEVSTKAAWEKKKKKKQKKHRHLY